MKHLLVTAMVSAMFTLSTPATAADNSNIIVGDPVAGKTKTATCVACHGANGNSSNPEWPNLAGQGEAYLFKQLNDFKAGKDAPNGRYNASMAPMVASLSEQDMADIAAYYAGLPLASSKADETQVELGTLVYKGGNNSNGVVACAACHGPNGNGNPAAKYPALAGQHATYTANQLRAFRSGERANDAEGVMRDIASKMTDAEINAVSEYSAGLQN